MQQSLWATLTTHDSRLTKCEKYTIELFRQYINSTVYRQRNYFAAILHFQSILLKCCSCNLRKRSSFCAGRQQNS